MAQDLNKMFLNVPETKVDAFTTDAELANHANKIAFIHGAGTIATHGEIFTGGTTNKPITVAGGPLADDSSDNWPAAWKDASGNKQIPANTSLQEILTKLFLKEVDGKLEGPTYTWSPSLDNPTLTVKQGTTTIANNKHLPLGTQLTVTYAKTTTVSNLAQTVTVTSDQGYFKNAETTHRTGKYKETVNCSYDTSSVSASATWGTAAISTGDTITVDVTGNKTVTVNNGTATFTANNFTGVVLYPSTNTKTKLTTGSKTIEGIGDLSQTQQDSSAVTLTVYGYKPVFYGKYTDTNIASSFWTADKMTAKSSIETAPTQQDMTTGDATIFIALPTGHGNYSKTLEWRSTADNSLLGTTQTTTVSFTHPNTTTTTTYKVFYVTAATGWSGTDSFKLVWK